MNGEIKEIIDVAKEVIDISEKANDLGFSSSSAGGIQVFDEDVFKKLAISSKQEPELRIRDSEYKYWYKIKVDGIRFLHITNEPLYFKNSDMEIVEEIKLWEYQIT